MTRTPVKCPPCSSASAHRGWMTRRGDTTGLRLADLAVLADALGFADAFEFEDFAVTQQAKAQARDEAG